MIRVINADPVTWTEADPPLIMLRVDGAVADGPPLATGAKPGLSVPTVPVLVWMPAMIAAMPDVVPTGLVESLEHPLKSSAIAIAGVDHARVLCCI